MGWSFPSSELGARVHAAILERLASGQVRPVVGKVVGFDELQAAMDAMAERATVGRTIVLV